MNGGLLLELDLLYFFLPLPFFMRHHSKRCLSVFLNYYISIRILYSIALCSALVFHSSQVGVIHLYCSHVDCRDQHYHNIVKVLFIQLFHNKNTNYIPPFEHHHQIHISLSDQATKYLSSIFFVLYQPNLECKILCLPLDLLFWQITIFIKVLIAQLYFWVPELLIYRFQ